MTDPFSRHEKAALMFSGGKDSLATLIYLKPHWDKITVVWVNTGNMFPENEAIVRHWQAQVPNFLEVKTNVEAWKSQFGIPSDIVPMKWTHLGQQLIKPQALKIASGWDCCAANIWWPGMNAVKEIGATLIIRGQRNQEAAKSPMRSGDWFEGEEFYFPIEDWTHEDVLAYLRVSGVDTPEFFNFEESSLDCMNCTAFISEMKDRREWLKKHHPHVWFENEYDIKKIVEAVQGELDDISKR